MIDKFSDHLLGVMLPLSVWEHNYKLAYDIKTTPSCCGLFLLRNIVAFDIEGFKPLNPHDRAPWCWARCLSCQSNTRELLATTWLTKQLNS